MLFCDVILPLPLAQTYTYAIPDRFAEQVAVGFRVLVPFGKKKIYTGIVVALRDAVDDPSKIKSIIDVLDAHPILLPEQLKFWNWIADYYLCTLGDVYKAAVPSGLKPDSDTQSSLEDDLHNAFAPKMETRVRLYQEQELLASGALERQLHFWLDALKRAPKQQEILARYLKLSGLTTDNRQRTTDD